MTIMIATDPAPLRVDDFGVVRVGASRVSLDLVVYAFLEGATASAIVERYPSLDLADVHGAISYYLRHRADVEAYLREQEALAERIQQANEARWPSDDVRHRIRAYRNGHATT